MATFPSAIPSYLGFTASHTLAADVHASQHNSEQADITAIATKLGTGASTPVNQRLLRGNGTGTSAWAQADLTTDVTGVLPVANGGNGTTSTTGTGSAVFSAAPALTGGGSWGGSPTLTTPTITDHTNAQHNHQNAAGGGILVAAALPALSLATQTLSNPYKFSAYRAAAQNAGNATFAIVNFDTELFDTNNNFDVSTNIGRYTAPVAGFYQFNARVGTNQGSGTHRLLASLYQNGVEVSRGNDVQAGFFNGSQVSDLLQLAAGDYVEVYTFADAALAIEPGRATARFSGFLFSNS